MHDEDTTQYATVLLVDEAGEPVNIIGVFTSDATLIETRRYLEQLAVHFLDAVSVPINPDGYLALSQYTSEPESWIVMFGEEDEDAH